MSDTKFLKGVSLYTLHYEDHDGSGTASVSQELKADDLSDAIVEARAYLSRRKASPLGLPKQHNLGRISRHYFFEISDLGLDTKP